MNKSNVNLNLIQVEFGRDPNMYDILTGFLEGSIIASVTRIRPKEVYIILINQLEQRVLQIIGDETSYQISAGKIVYRSRINH